MAELEEISLLIDDQVFKVNKNVLCEHSDYFRAMFSGNYIENEKQEISIDVVDANSMNILIRYMTIGLIDLAEFPLSTISELALAANFLQITELMKQIEYWLELQLSPNNWLETMTLAENATYGKLQELSAAYGLYGFKHMKSEYIQSVHKLVWYLSHTHLNAESELQVFKFGLNWIVQKEAGADELLLILGCLDLSRLTKEEIEEINILTKNYINSLAEKVIQCLYKLSIDYEISVAEIENNKNALCKMFTNRVYTEVLNLANSSTQRALPFKPCVALWTKEKDPDGLTTTMPQHLHIFSPDTNFEKWLQVADKDLWGWSAVPWGPTKIVVVCGEHGRGTGYFEKGLKVYDTLKKEWTEHGVQLPVRRHCGLAIVKDSLYLIGGVGGYRVVLDTAIVYDLKERSFRKIARFPDAIQSPAVCAHNNMIYAAGHNYIYRYEDLGETDRWVSVLKSDAKFTFLVSHKGYIYCTQNYFNDLWRFKPDVDNSLCLCTSFSNAPSTVCVPGDRLLAFTSTNETQSNMVTVEEYKENHNGNKPKVLWSKKDCNFTINEVAGSCAIVDTMPPVRAELSSYLKQCLSNYEAATSWQ